MHQNLHAHIDMHAEVCTSLLANRHLAGRHLIWAVVVAFGDNLADVARREAMQYVWRARVTPKGLASRCCASASVLGVVGLFDSLLDVPRLAWLFYLVVMIAMFKTRKHAHRHVIRPS